MNDDKIFFLDRMTGEVLEEKVYGQSFVEAFYGNRKKSRFYSFFLPLFACYPLVSKLYGALQKSHLSKRKVAPFIEKFGVDPSEFAEPVARFSSFNDFFIRHLKLEARPIAPGRDVAVLPADGRYLVYQDVSKADGFVVKGKKFSLEELLQDESLAKSYQNGAMVIARLCPTDYHRFHFPCSCTPSASTKIRGFLHSVNPLAIRKRVEIFAENKREITTLHTKNFGEVLFIEVGAICVGSIHQTFSPEEPYAKGDEKGYFSFGGSSLILLFQEGCIQFDQDLIDSSREHREVRGLMGQSLGRSLVV
jgi:phosphatidylserine decarboxylase